MRATLLFVALALSRYAVAAPTSETPPNVPQSYTGGFKDPSIQWSAGGKAVCVSGMIEVHASGKNVRLNLEEPANQNVVTELITELLQVDSTLTARLAAGENDVSGTYGVYSQLCFPSRGEINETIVQVLLHGAGFDSTYWNFAPDYSYVDFAAEQGYTTFLYDRIGTGLSEKPDAIQAVQLGLHIGISHAMVGLLRGGGISNTKFERIVGVGHSFGSFNLVGVTSSYPNDFDAAVLTGFSSSLAGIPVGQATVDASIASENQPQRFTGLSNSYLVTNSKSGLQSFFFRAPGFDPAILDLAEATKQTFGLGEMLTLAPSEASIDFTGPIFVANGLNDLPNCYGDCLYPENLAATVKNKYFPAARNSSNYLAPTTGHGLNLHCSANEAYAHIHDFLRENGF